MTKKFFFFSKRVTWQLQYQSTKDELKTMSLEHIALIVKNFSFFLSYVEDK